MSRQEPYYLVVGADGLVGAGLVTLLEQVGAGVTATTRRPVALSTGNRVFLDLANQKSFDVLHPYRYSVAFICAAVTNIAACEDDPAHTRQVNVLNTVALARQLLDSGTRIVYLSSNTVFDGHEAWPDEDSAYAPTCEYGQQKMAAERQLLAFSSPKASVAIVRLSKILSADTGIAATLLRHLAVGESCSAFADLSMCPISLDYSISALLAIARSGQSGIFHLSGEEEISYADFACRLAMQLGAAPSLVQSASSAASAARVLFRPAHPGLGMQRTRKLLGIGPEPTTHMMNALALTHSQ